MDFRKKGDGRSDKINAPLRSIQQGAESYLID
jgi:hypothetical protein